MSRFNTGNPLGSGDPRDLDDNAKNMDLAVNSDGDTFQDRMGKSRLTWAGIVKAGSGDPGEIVTIVQQAVQDVVDGVDGQVAAAQGAADRAETARDAAFVNADVYPDVETGRAAVADGEQFQVVEGDEIVRYRRNSASTQTEVARFPSSASVDKTNYRLDVYAGTNLTQPNLFTLGEIDFTTEDHETNSTQLERLVDEDGVPYARITSSEDGRVNLAKYWFFDRSEFGPGVNFISASVQIMRLDPRPAGAGVELFVLQQYNSAGELLEDFRKEINLKPPISSPVTVGLSNVELSPDAVRVLFRLDLTGVAGVTRFLDFRYPLIAAGEHTHFRLPAEQQLGPDVAALKQEVEDLGRDVTWLKSEVARPTQLPVFDATNIPLASSYDKQQVILDGDPPEMAFSYKDQWRTYGGDILPLSESACAEIVRLRGGVAARSLKVESGAFLVSNKYLNDTGAEYRLIRNVDGLLQNKSARVGGVGLTPTGAGQPASDLTGITAHVPSGNSYTSTIGGSWSSSFNGDAFSFRSYADDRGGVWRMAVDEGTEKEKILMVSTWSETTIPIRYVGYSGFGPGVHTVKAIFVGEDPEHPPTSQARGWFIGANYSTIYDASWGVQSGAPDILGVSVNEFAINAKATASPQAGDWVPSHGARAGSTQNIRTRWIIDGVESQEPTGYISTFQTIRIEQEYEAYSTNDTESLYKMWDGVLVIEFGEFGIRYENHIHTTQELSVSAGYVGQLAANLNSVDRVLFSTGVDMPVSIQESGEKRTYIFPHAQSATYYNSDGSAYLAMTVRSINEVADESDEESLFITERADNVSKVYWRKWGVSIIPSGSKISAAVLTVAGGRV